MDNFTHRIELNIGLDLTELLAPENIPGVKKYLGIEKDSDLVQAIASDQYKKIEDAINKLGLSILDAKLMKLDSETHSELEPKDGLPDDVAFRPNENVKEINKDIETLIVNSIKDTIKDFEKSKSNINDITIAGEYLAEVMTADKLREETGLNDDISINFDDLEEGIVMIISYIDKNEEMKFKIIQEKESED